MKKKASAAGDTAANQLKRLMTLIPRLADGDEHKIADVATIVDVTPAQLIEDLRSLVDRFDAPGGFVDGVQIFQDGENVSVLTPHFLRPMRLTMAELCALELGLALVIGERKGDDTAPSKRALERLRAVIAHVPGDDRVTGLKDASLSGAGIDPSHLGLFRGAIRARKKVRLIYRKGSATEPDRRTVCPYSLFFQHGMWYLVAHCDREAAIRVFRLDRLEGADVEGGSYEMPADYSVDRVLEEGRAFVREQDVPHFRVRYSAKIARWIAEREGRELEADGTLVVERPMASQAWAVRHVLQYGAEAEVLGPPEVIESVSAALDRLSGRD